MGKSARKPLREPVHISRIIPEAVGRKFYIWRLIQILRRRLEEKIEKEKE